MQPKVYFQATIQKFLKHGDKTGWSYIDISLEIAEKIFPGNRKAFKVKGRIDDYEIRQISLLPAGEGNFIMALNSKIRKAIRKEKGASINLYLERDLEEKQLCEDFIYCLKEDSSALSYFNSLPKSHQFYFSDWIISAKTEETKAKRIALSINFLALHQSFSEMIRSSRKNNN